MKTSKLLNSCIPFLAVVALSCMGQIVQAQTIPTKPVHLVVGFPPGGMADVVARVLSEKLAALWSVAVVVENRQGASGAIAADLVAKANPDGHTLLVILTNHVVIAAIKPKLPYDTLKDFATVSLVGESPLLIMANPKLPANNLTELMALAKSKPGVLTYSTPGDASVHHLSMELLCSTLGIKMVHVPYIGGAPAMLDAMSGVVDLNIGSPSQALQQIDSGKLKALAYTGSTRSTLLPNVLTVNETSINGFSASLWAGVLAPAKTPKALVAKIQSDIHQVMLKPETKDKMNKIGIDVVASSPEDFEKFLNTEFSKWSVVAKQAGVKDE